ncbi:Sulfide:quinone oxidoreductase, mitochondrial [Choanephora cucurbitarum]|uniref:Sulfide:quinone oxidoreductase, mitochondrial n=1 Tax=Choanephora cucurbitarum TaxID=101091 RepID=A0A1C7NST0_9FUNG|nr:Sulfide:quinone oxidoreductase, mitochondrial [Choanephora cucurbitarum]
MLSVRARLSYTLNKRTFATVTEAARKQPSVDQKFKVVVVGGGPGGLSVSSTISKLLGKNQVAVIEPSLKHYYQPLWTYVGGGLKSFNESVKPMGEVMPSEAEWIQDKVASFDPDNNTVKLADGQVVGYDYLVVAAGIQINWDAVKGLKDALGKDGVTSNYDADSVQKTYKFLQEFKGGNALFTFPNSPLKCPGAPTKITFLAEEVFRQNGVRDKTNVIYNTAAGKIFGVDYYGEVLQKLANERNIAVNFQHELLEIDANNHKATFRNNINKEIKSYEYDFIHVAPPQGPPTFIKESKLADAAGWVDVNKDTCRHNKYKNVFALGDCSSLPTSKTAAAITGESGVLKKNLIADLEGKKIEEAVYDGYTSCPLIVGRDQLILAEFSGYTGKPLETFPVDQRQISKTAQYLNKEIIPSIYWNGLLKGTWTGPSTFRRLFDPVRSKHD